LGEACRQFPIGRWNWMSGECSREDVSVAMSRGTRGCKDLVCRFVDQRRSKYLSFVCKTEPIKIAFIFRGGLRQVRRVAIPTTGFASHTLKMRQLRRAHVIFRNLKTDRTRRSAKRTSEPCAGEWREKSVIFPSRCRLDIAGMPAPRLESDVS